MGKGRFIEVILPLKLEWNPFYIVPDEAAEGLSAGARVRVRFAGREYVGVVAAVDVVPGLDPSRVMPVIAVEDGLPSISEAELRLWRFISDYYLCSIGEVYKAAYPVQKIRSEETALDAAVRAEKSREKMISALRRRIDGLKERLAKKEAALVAKHNDTVRSRLEGEREKILKELAAAGQALEKYEVEEVIDFPPAVPDRSTAAGKPLLLTSSDRRASYISLARETLDEGSSVLVLVPENDFASIIENMLREEFGQRLLVFSSRQTAVKRRKTADEVRAGRVPYVIVGTRSALYLPFSNLGLVIVDEEQDPMHKQTDPAPRINSRDCAAMLASIHGARFVLGSATPSLETIFNCATGKYLRDDDSSGQPCATEVIDVAAERRKNGMAGPYSLKLKQIISGTEGRVVVVRGWENQEELDGWTRDIFGDGRIEVLTAPAARKIEGKVPLIAVLQADAFFSKDDFRTDERALQLLRQIGEHACRLVVQTARSAHPVFTALSAGADASVLLDERKQFGLPPFTKIIDIHIEDTSESRRELMSRRLCKALHTGGLRLTFDRDSRLAERKSRLRQDILAFEKDNAYPSHIKLDVDPQ